MSNAAAVEQAVYFSQHVGIIFDTQDGIAKNSFLVEQMNSFPAGSIDTADGQTSFNVDAAQLGYFMHMMFANMPEGFMLQADFDGIHTFEGQDEQGQPARFNAQLVTLSQVPTPMPNK